MPGQGPAYAVAGLHNPRDWGVSRHALLRKHQRHCFRAAFDRQGDANPHVLHVRLNLSPAAPAGLGIPIDQVGAQQRLVVDCGRLGLPRRGGAQLVAPDFPGLLGSDLYRPGSISFLPGQVRDKGRADSVDVRVTERIDRNITAIGFDGRVALFEQRTRSTRRAV